MSTSLDWLLDDDLLATDDERAAFAELPLPEGLAVATLAAVDAIWEGEAAQPMPAVASAPEAIPTPANHWRWGLGALAAAALALLVLRPGPLVGDPANMVARGLAETSPEVALKVAARRGGRLERLSDGGAYAPGDTLFFRVQSGSAGRVALVHVSDGQVNLIAERGVQPGEADLLLEGAPLTWTIEAGDHAGVFALISANEPIPEAALRQTLQTPAKSGDALSAGAVCEASQRAGWRCDAVKLEVTP